MELVAGDQDVGPGGKFHRLRAEIDDAGEPVPACEREDVVARREPAELAVVAPRRLMANAQRNAVETEHRRRVVRLRLDRERRPVFGLVEPRSAPAVAAE